MGLNPEIVEGVDYKTGPKDWTNVLPQWLSDRMVIRTLL